MNFGKVVVNSNNRQKELTDEIIIQTEIFFIVRQL